MQERPGGRGGGQGRQFLGSSSQESLMLPKVSTILWPEAFLSLETWAGTLVNMQTVVPNLQRPLSQTDHGIKGRAWSRAVIGQTGVCC